MNHLAQAHTEGRNSGVYRPERVLTQMYVPSNQALKLSNRKPRELEKIHEKIKMTMSNHYNRKNRFSKTIIDHQRFATEQKSPLAD